ncbi:hypothetical protein KXX27_009234, partial [Aspergillus fumigatus]
AHPLPEVGQHDAPSRRDILEFYADTSVSIPDELIEAFDVYWSQESATGDAIAEGNVYFAGEHLSRHHTWIAGALDSAIQTVADMLEMREIKSLGEEYSRAKKGALNVQRSCGQKRCSYSIPLHNNV